MMAWCCVREVGLQGDTPAVPVSRGKETLLILHYRTRPGIRGAPVRRDEGSTHDMRS